MKRDEVEEFLRRAAARRAKAEAQRRAQQGKAPAPPAPQQRPTPARLVQSLGPDDVVILNPVDAEIVEAEVVGEPRRLSTPPEGLRSARVLPSSEIDQADEQMEAHLHQVFDHQLGHLRKDNIATGPPPPVAEPGDTRISEAAASIRNMLKSPGNLRNAIILNEILTPPRHLW
jgi:hypothetical protein